MSSVHLDPNLLTAKITDDDMWLVNEWVFGPPPQAEVLNNHYFLAAARNFSQFLSLLSQQIFVFGKFIAVQVKSVTRQ